MFCLLLSDSSFGKLGSVGLDGRRVLEIGGFVMLERGLPGRFF